MTDFSVAMRPTSLVQTQAKHDLQPVTISASEALAQARARIAGGTLDLRITLAPTVEGIPAGTYLWAVVERFPSGHEEIILGSHAASVIEAAAQGSTHFERISKERS